MFKDIVERALAKRDYIIAREGDANGRRLEPWYLESLIDEEIQNFAQATIINLAIPIRRYNTSVK